MISQQLLQETQQRFRDREEPRATQIEKIATGAILEADTPHRVQQRLKRLAVEGASVGSRAMTLPAATTFSAARKNIDTVQLPQQGVGEFSVALERIIGQSDLTGISYLELGLQASRSVGRIRILDSSGRLEGYGTGFLVSPRLLLTNNHVLTTAGQAAFSQVEFNFQDDVSGRPLNPMIFGLDPTAFFLTDEKLDYSLVAVQQRGTDGISTLQGFGWSPLIEQEGKVILGEYLNIIQHPNGEPKQLALRENQLVDLLDDFLHYRTDTAPGSSGSPVFNDQWEVVSLHHSGVPRRDAQGRLLSRDGTLWRSEMGEHRIDWIANEGVRVSRIVAHLKGQPLHTDAQRRLRNALLNGSSPRPGSPLADHPSPPVEASTPPATNQAAASPGIGADGSAVWTIPLQVSIRLGLPGGSAESPAVTSPEPQSGGVVSQGGAGFGAADHAGSTHAAGELPEDNAELREALAELESARDRTYYDQDADERSRDEYYAGIPEWTELGDPAEAFQSLSDLLQRTHDRVLRYQPSKHVYPWADLYPDLQIRSIYSGQEFDPAELIREDFRIEQRREQFKEQFREMQRAGAASGLAESTSGLTASATDLGESAINEAREAEALDFFEAALPYNCEHVVPQSWFGKKEPMRGDLHHLFACESGCNSFRGNTPYFDFEDFGETVRTKCGKGLRDEHKFEPETGKGAVARATLYFLLRYPGEINRTTKEYTAERVETLLQWHRDHEVTEYEKHRNMAIFEKQGNRNPLIDFPDRAEKIDFQQGLR